MRIVDSCAECLLQKQISRTSNQEDKQHVSLYLSRVEKLLQNREENDSAPYLVSVFNDLFEEYFGAVPSYADVKKEYNDLVLSMESDIEKKIQQESNTLKDCLLRALLFSRIGNYIDFGAMNHVDSDTFLSLFDSITPEQMDLDSFESFYNECSAAKTFLLIADNCGEIVLDKLFIRFLKKCFPDLSVSVMVRGKEVLNDATVEDALYVGIQQEADIVSNGTSVAGTIYELITPEAQKAMDNTDVILSKGQGNYESLAGHGRHIYYSLLCKCDLFTTRFGVPLLSGVFVSEP